MHTRRLYILAVTVHKIEDKIVDACRRGRDTFDSIERIGERGSDLVDALFLVEMLIIEGGNDVCSVVRCRSRGGSPSTAGC